MKVFPKDTIEWALWLMHGLETFILTIFIATILGIRVECNESLNYLNTA